MTTTFGREGFSQRPIGNPPGTPVPPPDTYAAAYQVPAPESRPADAPPPVALPPAVLRASGALVAAAVAQAVIAGFFVLAGVGALSSGHPGFSPFIFFGLFNAHRVLCVRFGSMGRAQSPLLRGPIFAYLALSLCYALALITALGTLPRTAPHTASGLFTALLAFLLGVNALTLPHLKDAR